MDLIDENAPGGNAPEFSVSELSGAVKRVVEGAFDHVRVRGEVGRVSRPRSGHIYLDLKDDRAVLASVCWKGVAARLDVQPEEGMEVVATGRLTTFAGQSRYQLVIESLAPAGMGALMAMLEKRKAALAAEGLFAAERKRPIPYLPRVVGVVTSPSGAVIRDILHRLAERFPLDVLVWPVAVQGQSSAAEVACAIRGFNALPADGPLPRPDVLIVARGGGSVEDLWGFNEEIVVRAAAESAIPLISAVGHETDTTLIDFASDQRAPTPTAAAELAVPVRGELAATLAGLEERRQRALSRSMEERARRLRDLLRAAPRPADLLAERRQRLDGAGERLPRALMQVASAKRIALGAGRAGRFGSALLSARLTRFGEQAAGLGARLAPAVAGMAARRKDALSARALRLDRAPERLIGALGERNDTIARADKRLSRAAGQAADAAQTRLSSAVRMLEGLSYRGVLARGFAVVRSGGGVVSDSASVKPGAGLVIEMRDGDVAAVAAGGPAAAVRPSKPRKSGGDDDQGALDL